MWFAVYRLKIPLKVAGQNCFRCNGLDRSDLTVTNLVLREHRMKELSIVRRSRHQNILQLAFIVHVSDDTLFRVREFKVRFHIVTLMYQCFIKCQAFTTTGSQINFIHFRTVSLNDGIAYLRASNLLPRNTSKWFSLAIRWISANSLLCSSVSSTW